MHVKKERQQQRLSCNQNNLLHFSNIPVQVWFSLVILQYEILLEWEGKMH